jgi:hypothetical protein
MELQAPSPSAIEAMRMYSEAEMPRAEADIAAEAQARAALFSIPAELVEAPAIIICSIWPEPLDSQPFHHGGVGRKIYSIAAGSPENPAYLIIKNTWDWTIVQEGQGQRGDRQTPIFASSVANDLIRHWTGDHPGNRRGKKGVGIVVGQLNEKTRRMEATPAEIASLEKAQKGFLTYLVERADQFWDSGQREKVAGSLEYRKALRMLGLDINQHPWYRSKVQLYNDCPLCAEKVSVNAIHCKHCHSSITAYFVDRDIEVSKAEWPKVYDDMKRPQVSKKK